MQRRPRDDAWGRLRPGAHLALSRRAAGGMTAQRALMGYVQHSAAALPTPARRRAARGTHAPGLTTTFRCASRPQHRGALHSAAGARCSEHISYGSVTSVRGGGVRRLSREFAYRRRALQRTDLEYPRIASNLFRLCGGWYWLLFVACSSSALPLIQTL